MEGNPLLIVMINRRKIFLIGSLKMIYINASDIKPILQNNLQIYGTYFSYLRVSNTKTNIVPGTKINMTKVNIIQNGTKIPLLCRFLR